MLSRRAYSLNLEIILNRKSPHSYNQNLVASTIYRHIEIDHIISKDLTLGCKHLIYNKKQRFINVINSTYFRRDMNYVMVYEEVRWAS